ncbi:hypothetical protein DNTS_028185 [Danionella cerebrum]|uniref:Calpain catalytic domain-containing protein n=1 Tax=Danionella cerebrum TaxID=2873325 RepID=A0A553QR70_9TELE|nr:hypothetical protein DNTS_028185 [Danionella translucida]
MNEKEAEFDFKKLLVKRPAAVCFWKLRRLFQLQNETNRSDPRCLLPRNLREGRGSPSDPERFLDQDFQRLKQSCLKQRLRFTDNLFPPEMKSIGFGALNPDLLWRVEWRRPHELVQNPVYIDQGASRFDFSQGSLGNCWFLASVGALTFQKDIMALVIQDQQTFSVDYAGIFHFRFWRFGSWVDVVIDDKLPTINGQLVFVHSKTQNEFWPALLEKAYAKVCGSYADMDAGHIADALKDFTGGPHMSIDLREASEKLWDVIRRAGQSESLMGCGTPGGRPGMINNKVSANGLVEMHAYTVTGVTEVVFRGHSVKLVRIFNPWGHGEWNQDWSDRSPLWHFVRPEDQKNKVELDDGEFWMSMEDFCRNFSDLDICCTDVNVLAGSDSSFSWKTDVHKGQWIIGITAGGCSNDIESFSKNPQFLVTLKETVEDSRDARSPNLLVSLIQKSDKRNRHLATNLFIGFNIFQVKDIKEKFPASFFRNAQLVGKNKSFINSREVMEFFRLKAGNYLIVPSTFKPNEASSFALTVYTKMETIIQDSSGYGVTRTKMIPRDTDETFKLFAQYADKFGEVDAERLQRLLNENLSPGRKTAGFSLDLCRSLVALMDDIFYSMDASHTGHLSVSELRNALKAAGFVLSDSMLNLMTLRYRDSSGGISLESFVMLVVRMDCMAMDASRYVFMIKMKMREIPAL